MPIRNYPFLSVVRTGPNSAKVLVQGTRARPRLWIRVIGPDKNLAIEYPAIIDTGADACACPVEIASQLGYDLESVKHETMNTAKGETKAYPHKSKFEILEVLPNGAPGTKVLYTTSDITMNFTEGLPEFLLGRKQFLNKFILTIDYIRQTSSLRLPIQPQHKKEIKRRRR